MVTYCSAGHILIITVDLDIRLTSSAKYCLQLTLKY